MATAVLYGVLTSWGFAKHSWLVAKWVLSIVVIVSFALLPFSTATVGAMLVCVVALFALSVFKPGMKKSKKAKAKKWIKAFGGMLFVEAQGETNA